MASALLASRNEPYWGERKVYMRKNPNPNPKSNPNPNPNSKKLILDPLDQIHVRQTDEPAAAAASDDSSSLNRKSISLNRKEPAPGAAVGYVTFNIANFTKRELRELKKRLISDLEQVRSFTHRIDRDFQSRSGYSASQFSGNYCGGREVTSARPPALNLSALDAAPSSADAAKEKRTPKANQYYRPSEFVVGKEKLPPPPEAKKASGSKRPLPPPVLPRDAKRPMSESSGGAFAASAMKKCGQILAKLMKHKHGWIFNVPVDVIGMGLHDYNQIIKHPMDLGTVKSRLKKNQYSSPAEFAADVRLTFNNAQIYNPKGHDVYAAAEQLLSRFEEMFRPLRRGFENELRRVDTEEMRPNSWAQMPVKTLDSAKRLERSPPSPNPTPALAVAPAPAFSPNPPPAQNQPTPSAKPMAARSTTPKQPKPKAKDPNKREMSYEEKQKLGTALQNLPPEKMEQVLQIIRRRNPNLSQNGDDEIEIDIEAVDTETLWELDRFAYNCKKLMSKLKRQALAANQMAAASAPEGDKSPPPAVEVADAADEVGSAKKSTKKGETGEEDVDIGEDMPSTNFPPVEIEKDTGGNASRSSSSSSSSSDSSSSSGTLSHPASLPMWFGFEMDDELIRIPVVLPVIRMRMMPNLPTLGRKQLPQEAEDGGANVSERWRYGPLAGGCGGVGVGLERYITAFY
ncbi:hypothetical protein ACLOJK_036165 [Asimina triloba]